MSIKACSHLEETVIGTPKELYARFDTWASMHGRMVLETANKKLDHPLMAFRFSRTERFARPITLTELQQADVPQPQNPRHITSDQFAAIYKRGFNL